MSSHHDGSRRDFTRWAADHHQTWDQDTGAPTILHFGNAIQVWAIFQNRPLVSVAEAARAFNCDPQRVIEAVTDHPWMLLVGPTDDYTRLAIEHDGE